MIQVSEMLNKEHERVEKGEIPPQSGEMHIELEIEPMSSGASAKSKKILRKSLHEKCKQFQFLLSGDVQIEIIWMVHEQYRYECHKAPDIDNIIKPILDCLSGPDGILIDDTQIQYIGCRWIDWTEDDHKLEIVLNYFPDLYVRKKDLQFVEFDQGLCFPINTFHPEEGIKILLDAVSESLRVHKKLEDHGMDYYDAKGVLPIQRFFHRNKLTSFTIIHKDQLIGGV